MSLEKGFPPAPSFRFKPQTWEALQDIARKVAQIPPPQYPDRPRDDGDSGDREPRNPKPASPTAGAIALELVVEKEE